MLDQRAATRLLASARSIPDLAPLARAAGLAGDPLPLDALALRRIGIEELAHAASIAAGGGALRGLLVELPEGNDDAGAVATIASRLTRHAPDQLWLLVASGARQTTIATWSPDKARPRVAALRVDRRRVLPSDAETIAMLASSAADDDTTVHARWLEILGRDALGARFYRALESLVRRMTGEVGGTVSDSDGRSLALLTISRLLFLAFLETRGFLNDDPRFLSRAFECCMRDGGRFHRRVLLPLFFGTLNTPVRARAPAARAFGRIPFLNGGLFSRGAIEKRHRCTFSDELFGAVFDELLLRYRFTPHEEQPSWAEAAVDPEMLGRAFESLMASEARRSTGTFYTPQSLVATLVDRGLRAAVRGDGLDDHDIDAALDGQALRAGASRLLHQRLSRITIVDPACGSGAFLVYALERVSRILAHLDRTRPAAHRRLVLTRSIFGVDLNSTAVWLCQLRLWLSVVVDRDSANAIEPLPNLDQQIRIGDSLAGELPAFEWRQPGGAAVARLRLRYARASGANKRAAARMLERAERGRRIARVEAECSGLCAARRELMARLRTRDLFGHRTSAMPDDLHRLERLRTRIRALRAELRQLRDGGALPFAWSVHAGDVLDSGGFDLVIGNPPWVRLHRIPPRARETLRRGFEVFRRGGWAAGRELARAGVGFAAQVDLAALFVERSLGLVRPGGAVALLLPSKLWHSLAGGGVRHLLQSRARLELLEDWGSGHTSFDAAVYPSAIVATAGVPDDDRRGAPLEVVIHDARRTRSWQMHPDRLPVIAADGAAPWVLLPPESRTSFDCIRSHGVPLAQSGLGQPTLGVKTGDNEAFIVRVVERRGARWLVTDGARNTLIEAEYLRPLVRGETLNHDSDTAGEHIIWPHDRAGVPLARLPAGVAGWLAPYEQQLRRRADVRAGMPWWTLFRTPSARYDRARVVWADVSRDPRVRVLAPGDPTVALNSCYVISCADTLDASALAALLRSPVTSAWMRAIAEPARGGFVRWLGWTVALVSIPRDWRRARKSLGRLTPDTSLSEHLRVLARAYGVPPTALVPLLEWNAG